MSAGWVKIHRCMQDNELWYCEKFTRGQAWVDMILLANHESSYFFKRGVRVDVSRGQLARSEVELASRWQWSRNKVRGFLEHLKNGQQITIEKSNVTQIVTIVNYDKYQNGGQQPEQQIEQQMDSKRYNRRRAERHIQECKEDKKVKKTTFNPQSIRPEWISEDDWWDLIAHRKARRAVNTERAYWLLIEELEKAVSAGFSIKECVDTMTKRNWTGFEAEWMMDMRRRQPDPKTVRVFGPNPPKNTAAAIARELLTERYGSQAGYSEQGNHAVPPAILLPAPGARGTGNPRR